MLLLISTASAQVFIDLTDPGLQDAGFVDRLEARDALAREFFAFLGNGLLEQAFALRHQPSMGSAALSTRQGWSAGVTLDTFPLSPPQTNLIGKEENTSFSPVLPRVNLALLGGTERRTWGLGWSLTPPIAVGGASALVVGVDGSYAVNLGTTWRLGAELRASVGRARAPVTATPEQAEEGQLGNTDATRYAEVCTPQPHGCTDVFSIAHVGLHGVLAWNVSPAVRPYARLGLEYLSDDFFVQVDASGWRLWGVLPDIGLGATLFADGPLGGHLGGSFAWVPDEVATYDRLPLLYRLDLSGVVRF